MRDNDEGKRTGKANSDYDIVKEYINSLNIGLLIIVAIGIYNDNLLETITGMLNDKKPVAIGLLVGGALSAAMVIHKLMSVSGE